MTLKLNVGAKQVLRMEIPAGLDPQRLASAVNAWRRGQGIGDLGLAQAEVDFMVEVDRRLAAMQQRPCT